MTLHQFVALAGMVEILALGVVLAGLGLPKRDGGQLRLKLRMRSPGGRARPARSGAVLSGTLAATPPAARPPATAPPGPRVPLRP